MLRRPFEPRLAAAIGMMDEARSRAAPLDCHDERGDGEFGTHVLAHRPANHLAGISGCATAGYPFVRAYPRKSQEMVFDAHIRAFEFFKGTCTRGIYPVLQQLRRRYSETGVTIRNQILIALRKEGLEIDDADMQDERKRSRQ